MSFLSLIWSFVIAIFIYTALIEIFAPARIMPEPKVFTEEEQINEIASRYDSSIIAPTVEPEPMILPKIVNIVETAGIGFNLFYFFIFLTLWLQLFYAMSKNPVDFVAVDLNVQAPPMLGVGGTIYALVNVNLSASVSIIETLSAVLIGAGLTTLLGIFIYIVNHTLTRWIVTKN